MSQINLLSGSEAANRPQPKGGSGSVFLSLALLVVVFGAYFGLLFYKEMLQKSFDAKEAESVAMKKRISGEKADRVSDFFDRMTVIDANLKATAESPNAPLAKIEQKMVPTANISSYKYDAEEGSIQAVIAADSFRAVAEQIVAFKEAFSSVMVEGDTRVGVDGKIVATLVIIP